MLGISKKYTFICVISVLTVSLFSVALGETNDDIGLETNREKLSYAIGMQIAQSLKFSDMEIDIDVLIRGLLDQFLGDDLLLTEQQVRQVQNEFMAQQADDQEQQHARGQHNRERSREFLDNNKEKDNIYVTDSGLQYEIIESSDGVSPGPGDTVEVHYVGKTFEGRTFDSSRARGEPAAFPLDGIVPGLAEGIQLMNAGEKYVFYLPPELGYGERGIGEVIEPNTALIFEIELLGIVEQ